MELRIKDVLKEKKVTVVSLAGMIGITQPNMSNIVNGKSTPSLETLEKIATVLNVPTWQLIASPGEVAKETKSELCPHCYQPIAIKTIIEKVD